MVRYASPFRYAPAKAHSSATSNVGTSESYTFTYLNNQTVSSPFSPTQNTVAILLQSATTTGLGVSASFLYGLGTGEMTQMTTPLGGSLSWQYRTYTYSGNRSYREVQTRQMTPLAGQTGNTWNITLDNASNLHTTATVADVGAGTSKVWTYTSAGLTSSYEERETTGASLLKKDYTWTTDATGRSYVGAVLTTLNSGQTYAAQSKTEQTLDTYGNITQSKIYNYGNLTTPARTYNLTYLTDGNYISRYIRNRLTQATVTPAGGATMTLVQNSYDQATCGVLQWRGNLNAHDSTNYGASFTYRGNLTSTSSLGKSRCTAYEITGIPYKTVDGAGRTVNITPSGGTSY
jgi:hypothetical protein